MQRLLSAAGLLAVLWLSGCATAPLAPSEHDLKAKTFSTAADSAALYIYRNENFGGAVSMDISINGKIVGQSAARTYFQLDLAPGQYSIDSRAENTSNLTLNLEAGKNYYVWQEVKMGVWYARSLLQQVDEAVGQKGVLESRLIATAVRGSDIPPLDANRANQSASGVDAAKRLRELQKLKDDGLINQEEFDQKRQRLMDQL